MFVEKSSFMVLNDQKEDFFVNIILMSVVLRI